MGKLEASASYEVKCTLESSTRTKKLNAKFTKYHRVEAVLMPVSEVWALERIDGNYVVEGALLQSSVQEEAAC